MKKSIIASLAVLIIIASSGALLPKKATAVTASDWQAGRIVDDAIFTNPNDMTVADIQNFLNSKVSACDTNGTKQATEYGRADLTHAQYAALKGWPGPPYVCLKDYYEVPKYTPGGYIPANNFSGSIPSGAVSAAQIIYDAARLNNINPKVILIKIATESSGPLTSDTWPLQSQYTYAMGSHCPDSGPNGTANCDSNYAGFSMQVASGAGLLRWYIDNMQQSWWAYKKPYQTNSILWSLSGSGCGSSNVYIQGKATAALYTYTPYQPNQAALNDMYGGNGDSCSQYGNRNFWRVWNDWFGSPLTPSYHWKYAGQNLYTDSTMTTAVDFYTTKLNPNTRYYAVVSAQNDGSTTWNQGNFRLGTTSPDNHASILCTPEWMNCARAATLTQTSVAPGSTGTFGFWITTPGPNQSVTEYFNPLQEGVTWLNNIGLSFPISTGTYAWQYAGQGVYTDATKATYVNNYTQKLQPLTKYYAVVRAKNTGTATWNQGDFRLGTSSPNDRSSQICASDTWVSCTRPATLTETSVAPGQVGTFEFWFTTPGPNTTTNEYFNLLRENVTWLNNIGLSFPISTGTYAWQYAGQGVYTDATKATYVNNYTQKLQPLTKYYAVVRAKNTGTATWNQGDFRLGTSSPNDRSSQICASDTWVSCTRPATLTETSVAPGQVGTFEFWFTTPGPNTTTNEYFNLLRENVTWLNNIGLSFPIST